MNSLTKNIQSEETLLNLIHHAFPHAVCTGIEELTEGYFNVAYKISLKHAPSCILKIAPPKDALVMSYEKNIMMSEVLAMRTVKEQSDVPVAKVLFYDDSLSLIHAPYFFMEILEGASFHSILSTLSPDVQSSIRTEAGCLNKKINSIQGKQFGYLGQPSLQGNDWYHVFSTMIELAFSDGERLSIDLKISKNQLFKDLEASKELFDEIKTPVLVHWDLWDGNIFVKDNRITGLIDWERSLWADPLMEVGFRTYISDRDFYKGYGIESLSEKENIRVLWYDVYTMLLVSQECDYRQYDTRDMYNWATGNLVDKCKDLNRIIHSGY
ncbi:phosphotransferase family protein [Lacrimispora defluvii]|uniref:Aminoglycoside phosphotransferase family protein n=1 Tax=Lacrimispora defluvii TaxID=2719233 RepID=A0ABX1VSA5_9FIRM|nr:aminoglycoside phosphotransferase family protein [Lacrimispora defluvii]NNJ31315.1 aminoglycoside phosphotransferase family protein [Lacrimispora defluvii]